MKQGRIRAEVGLTATRDELASRQVVWQDWVLLYH